MSSDTWEYKYFKYYADDCDCEHCQFYQASEGSRKCRCILDECCCADIRAEAIASGRIKRAKGWNKWNIIGANGKKVGTNEIVSD